MALKLKDISNLPPNLPVSQIPQQVSSSASISNHTGFHDQWVQGCSFLPTMKQPVVHPQQQRMFSLSENDSGYEVMDDSLTDMQWLQRMDAGSDFPGLAHGQRKTKGLRNGNKDGCRKKLEYTNSKKDSNKPPLSYASLIALAICSTPQRMMTLSSIYRWIEYTFPFYRTPEAKAWKNSIRHNLSIRKNMFMKVYQYPPRRGNGSYWTLLSDGEEELKKAVPLFATLQPPVIDANCAYHREPSTHTVKSKGRFVPVLPRSDVTANLPYFSLGSNVGSGLQICSNINALGTEVDMEDFPENVCQFLPPCEDTDGDSREEETTSDLERPLKKPRHLHDHSYAKGLLREMDDIIDGAVEAEVIELATGVRDEDATKQDDNFSTPSAAMKQNSCKEKSCPQLSEGGHQLGYDAATALGDTPPFVTPTKDQDSSLHLLDSSLLTPLKSLVPEVDLGAISFSPLYSSLATPKHRITSQAARQQPASSDIQSHPYLPSPFTPLKGSYDSGIFSPLRADTLGGIKFSTPTNISPLGDLNSLNPLQPELCPLKVLDNSAGSTPVRPGSLRAFGLPGLTPPTAR